MDDILNDQYPIYIKGMNDDICVRDDSVTDEYKHVINQRYSPVDFCNYGECPTCGETVSGFSIASPDLYDKECPKCGQKLKW